MKVSEADFQRTVIEIARLYGWKVAHFARARSARGNHMTPTVADAAGFPDLTLVHPMTGRILFRELKAQRGALSPEQRMWGQWLTAAGMDWAVWKPSDERLIVSTLKAD